jgi:polar amino acid transport system permease protein
VLRSLGESLNPALFWEYRATLLAGIAWNLGVFAASVVLAVMLAFGVGVARLSRSAALRAAATFYTEFCRNAPEYVMLVWVYYVLPVVLTRLLATRFNLSPFVASVLALGVAYSGFLSETVRAGLLSVPLGHTEAALSLGMSRFAVVRRIVVPQAVRRMLPEALNQFVSLFKATTIVSLVAVPDIMYRVAMINVQEMRPLPLYTWAALLYCAIIIASTQAIGRLTDRWRQRGWA